MRQCKRTLPHRVLVEKSAEKGLKNAPRHVQNKFYKWVQLVESLGLFSVRKVLGFRDEGLKGKRLGQRSIRYLVYSILAGYLLCKLCRKNFFDCSGGNIKA